MSTRFQLVCLSGTYRKGVCVGPVAVHGDGGRVVEGAEHLHGEWVPVDLGILLRHPHVLTHTLVASMEPEEEKMRQVRAAGDERERTTAVGTGGCVTCSWL